MFSEDTADPGVWSVAEDKEASKETISEKRMQEMLENTQADKIKI